jgi:prepilin-type N-terminal cleavage/methylation domain-containing protein
MRTQFCSYKTSPAIDAAGTQHPLGHSPQKFGFRISDFGLRISGLPHRCYIQDASRAAFTLVEIMIVVATIGMLASIAIPNYVRTRATSQKNACINNLRQIDSAVQQWALENKQPATATPTFPQVTPYLKNSAVCPAGGTTIDDSYSLNDVQTPPDCISPGGGAAHQHTFPQ